MVHSSPDVARFIVFVAVLRRNRNMETAPAATTICPATAPPPCAPRTRNIIPPSGRIVYPETRPKKKPGAKTMSDAPVIDPTATGPAEYVPPKVWTWNKESGGRLASINRPIAGPTHDKELPAGKHPFQLYSLATPNGGNVTLMFEELLAAGFSGAEYDAWLIRIDGNQFGSGFVSVNPNSKIPALMDRSGPTPIRLFESGAILVHLAA